MRSVCGKEEGGDVKLKVCSACKHPDDIYCGTDCQVRALACEAPRRTKGGLWVRERALAAAGSVHETE